MPEECDKPYIRIRGTHLGGRFKIANVLTPVYEGIHEREAKETRANARLIAAAPDLLTALQALFDGGYLIPFASDTDEDIRLKNQARVAIKQATGAAQ